MSINFYLSVILRESSPKLVFISQSSKENKLAIFLSRKRRVLWISILILYYDENRALIYIEKCPKLTRKMSKHMYSTANLSDKELKEQGNRLFSLRRFEDAMNCYTKAIVSLILTSWLSTLPFVTLH